MSVDTSDTYTSVTYPSQESAPTIFTTWMAELSGDVQVLSIFDGDPTTLVDGVGYTLKKLGTSTGFTVNLIGIIPADTTIFIHPVTPDTEETRYTYQGAFSSTKTQSGFDRGANRSKKATNEGLRSINIPVNEIATADMNLPKASARADKNLSFDSSGNVTVSTGSGAPAAHAPSHKAGGSDEILLDELGTPTDNTDLNSTTSAHGLLPKLSGNANETLNGQGAFVVTAGDVVGPASSVDSNFSSFNGVTGKLIKDSGVGPSNLGETNTASNVGTGVGVFKTKSGVDLEFKEISGTSGISVVTNGPDDIGITMNTSGLATVTPASNDKLLLEDTSGGGVTPKMGLTSALPVSDATQTALDLKRNTADQINATEVDVANGMTVLQPDNLQNVMVQIDDALTNARSTGIHTFDGLATNGGTPANVDIGAGTGEIMDLETDSYKNVSWTSSLNTVITNQSVFITYYYVHDDNNDGIGTIVQTITPLTTQQRRTWIYLGFTSFDTTGLVIIASVTVPTLLQQSASALRDVIEALSPLHEGIRLSPAATDLTVERSAGLIGGYAIGFMDDKNRPHGLDITFEDPLTFTPGVQDGSVITPVGVLDVGNYNPTGNTISAVGGGPNSTTIFTAYTFADGVTVVLYGQEVFGSLTAAEESLGTYSPVVQDFFSNAALTTYILVERTATDLSDPAQAKFIYTNKFGLIGGGIASAGAGYLESANNLSDLASAQTARVNMNTAGWDIAWTAGSYDPLRLVSHNGGAYISNTTTTDEPGPIINGDPSFVLPDVPTFASPTSSNSVISGMSVTVPAGEQYSIVSYRFWVPVATSTYEYVVWTVNPDGVFRQIGSFIGDTLTVDAWTTITTNSSTLPSGDTFEIFLQTINHSGDTTVAGGWTRTQNEQTVGPTTGNWNTTNQNAILRINETDLDTIDRATELATMVPGTNVQIVDTAESNRSSTYSITGALTDSGTYVEYPVTLISNGPWGAPLVGEECTITATVPVPATTTYNSITNGLLATAAIDGFLSTSGNYEDAVTNDNAYGFDIELQHYDESTEWDTVAVGNTGGSTAPVTSVNGKTGNVVLATSDLTDDVGYSLIQRYVDIPLDAGGWGPFTTNGATAGQVVYLGNEFDTYAFDATTEEGVYRNFRLPEDYAGGTLRWSVDWDALATASGTAVFGLSGTAFADSDALSTARGTERTITDTLITVGDEHKSPNDATGITLSGTPVAGELCHLKFVVKTSGTIAVDVLMTSVTLQYQTSTTQPEVWT